MDQKMTERLMAEYHSYTCKMIAEFEETGEVKILGYGDWLEQRTEPERPNQFDNGR